MAVEAGADTSTATRTHGTARRRIPVRIGAHAAPFNREDGADRTGLGVGNPDPRCQTRGVFGISAFLARVTLPALLAFVVMTGAERLAGTAPVKSPIQPTSVFWANRIFATQADLAHWLRDHGASYQTWAFAHPRLAAAQQARTPPALAASSHPSHSKGQDPTHLIALAVAGCVALLLALVLFYQRRLYDFRGSLQRSPSALATAAVAAGSPPAKDLAISVRTHIIHPATAAAKAVASGAGPALLAVARSGAQRRGSLRHFRREHPDAAWYVGACAFAAAVGFAIPYLMR